MRSGRYRVPILAALFCSVPAVVEAHLGHDPNLRVYVVAIESLEPADVGPAMPSLAELAAGATVYRDAVSVLPAATLPNHAALMTGVLPRRSGIVAETHPGSDGGPVPMDSASLLDADTLVTRLERECLTAIETGTVMSRPTLYRLSSAGGRQARADFHQRPLAGLEREPDALGIQDFTSWALYQPTPQFGFLSLGDAAEVSRSDVTGVAGIPAARTLALAHADSELRYFVENLEAFDHWRYTILIVVSDHGIDWSPPTDSVSVTPARAAAGFGEDAVSVVATGGAAMVYVENEADVEAVAAVVRAVSGVAEVVTAASAPSLVDWGLDHPRTGDVVALAAPAKRFSEPSAADDLSAGNAGGGASQRTVLLVTGGHPSVGGLAASIGSEPATPVSPVGSRGVLSVAPTVAALFGLSSPAGTYDAAPLAEAFRGAALQPGSGPCAP